MEAEEETVEELIRDREDDELDVDCKCIEYQNDVCGIESKFRIFSCLF